MKHIHFDECPSTQSYLLDNLSPLHKENRDILVTTSLQSDGVGRNSKKWDYFDSSLALSFTLAPSKVVTMTPLEIGVLITTYLNGKFGEELQLKWPNDLLNNNGDKCGGIIAQLADNNTVVAGVGLNFGTVSPVQGHEYKTTPAAICSNSLTDSDKKLLCQEIYTYILDNRLTTEELIESWNGLCHHLNSKVRIEDDIKTTEGIFLGIGNMGQALIRLDNGSEIEVLAGSLYF